MRTRAGTQRASEPPLSLWGTSAAARLLLRRRRRRAHHCALRRPSASSCSWKTALVIVPPDSVGSFFATDACAGPRAATSARSRIIAAFIASRSAFAFAAFSDASFLRASSSSRRRCSTAALEALVRAATAAACAAACATPSPSTGNVMNSVSTICQPSATRYCRAPGTKTRPSATLALERRSLRYFSSAGALAMLPIILPSISSAGLTFVSDSAQSFADASSSDSLSSS
mmetsp:Transcript_42798/g.112591  ORF Transcript_42798/g.112591 Transcript_42798/m.112591 type:complete len:230 (-) Transcript_42798:1090-1779(-)